MTAASSSASVLLAAILLQTATPALGAPSGEGPMAVTRRVLDRSHDIVVGAGDRKQKLLALNELLREFLDTDALSREAMGKHLDGRTPEEVAEFLRLFRELFVRTYVQRLLLFEAPDFAYGEEKIAGRDATVGTEIVTPRDRFAVDYRLRKTSDRWRATDILVETVSIARNFRAQFDAALAKDSFQGMLQRLRKKLEGPVEGEF
jgi:ABC-type transporter MlaC component